MNRGTSAPTACAFIRIPSLSLSQQGYFLTGYGYPCWSAASSARSWP
jgi:hypothetical protein